MHEEDARMDQVLIPITPVGKPRMTKRDKWMVRPCVKKYRNYSDVLKLHAIDFQKSSSLFIRFEMPMPNSWSKKKKMKMHQKPHQQKPDIDNLVKAVLDSLFHDDSHVFYINAFKTWSHEGSVFLSNVDALPFLPAPSVVPPRSA